MERSVFTAELRAMMGDMTMGTPPLIEGYAAVFNQPSLILYSAFREIIMPGAFAESLANDDIRSLWNHNPDLVMGRVSNGTLRMLEDDYGLHIENNPPDTCAGRDAVTSIGRKDVNQMSFMFDALVDDWSQDDTGQIVRSLYKVKLYEVSPVTFPAYPQTVVGVRGTDNCVLPKMPDWVQARLASNDAEPAQVRMALRRRRLNYYLMQS